MSDEEAFEIAKERILEMLEEAERLKVAFAMEPHGVYASLGRKNRSRTIDGLKRLMELSDSEYYIINFDVGNIMQKPEDDSAELLSEVTDRVGYVHIKDKKFSDGKTKTCPVGTGDVNISGCVEVLKKAGYDGVLSLEVLGVSNLREQSKSESVAFSLRKAK